MPSRTPEAALAVARTVLRAQRDLDGALRLQREPPGLEGEGLVGAGDRPADPDGVSHGGCSFPAARVSPVTTDRERRVSSQSATPGRDPGTLD